MKKRLVTTLLSVVFCAAVAFTFAACDSLNDGFSSDQPVTGVQVTEEQWNTAFDRAFNANNVTVSLSMEGYMLDLYEDEVMIEHDIVNVAINVDEGKFHSGFKVTVDNHPEGNTGIDIYILYSQDDSAYYDINKQIFSSSRYYVNKTNADQYVDSTPMQERYSVFIQQVCDYFKLYSDNELKSNFWENYSEFEFKDGEYLATLRGNLTTSAYGHWKDCYCQVKVKIDEDGNLRACTINEVDGKCSITCKFDNYGTTKVIVPQDYLNEVEKYKREQEN